MSSTVFSLDLAKKALAPLQRRSMAELGLTEPYDLEAWLSSSSDGLFDRKILWLARQDRPSEEQRSDLIGIDQLGNVLITELKRGELTEDAVTQALAYAAEYASKSADDLAALFAAHSEKAGATGLVAKATSLDDARSQLSAHVGAGTEVNESQILLLLGEDFTAKALAVCDYLNGASGEARFSFECWRYGLFETPQKSHYFVLEQILPPPSVRQAIDEKREASKSKKYARDPVRMEFMRELVGYLWSKNISASRSRGQSYECKVRNAAWVEDHELLFSVHTEHPRLILPNELVFDGAPQGYELVEGKNWDGRRTLEFIDVDAQGAKFDTAFGDRLVQVVELLKPAVVAEAGMDQAAAALVKPEGGTA
jgi:hypothetical protein